MSENPVVAVLDPLTWTHDWSYAIEAAAFEKRGVRFVVPVDEKERDQIVPTADVIISSSVVPVDPGVISTLRNCVGIVCYGSGKDAVDLAAAEAAGLTVANIQDNAIEVADHAVTLLLALLRRLPEMSRHAADGTWDLRQVPEAWVIPRLSDVTVGVVGVGRAGRRVAELASAFGMTVFGYYRSPPDEPPVPHLELMELAARCDALVLCASLNESSRHMIDADVLAAMKPGSVLVNVGRGGLIDEEALIEALDNGPLDRVALDVRASEPPPADDHLSRRADVIQTPHHAGTSVGSLEALHHGAAAQAIRLLEESGRLR